MTDQPAPTTTTQTDKYRQRQRWGLGLIGLSLLFPFILKASPIENEYLGMMAYLFVWLGLSVVGSSLFVSAKGRGLLWGMMGLVPVYGPILLLLGVGVDDRLAKYAFRPNIRQAVFVLPQIIGGVLIAAISFPSYPDYSARARQVEARVYLESIYVAEKAFFEQHKRYGTFEEIGLPIWNKSNGTCESCRYTYRIDSSGKRGTVIVAREEATAALDNTAVSAGFSATGFTATAVANLDSDPTLDQWHVNDARQGLQKADVDDIPYGWEWILTLLMNSDNH